jgi:uncharacterized protein YndB with AHSA1/START domain
MAARNEGDAADPRALVTVRVIEAPRDLVFEAWTKQEHLAHWWGPNGFTITTTRFEFRPGGVWELVMHGPDGRDWPNHITFDEILRPERIVFHHGRANDQEPMHHRTMVTFEDLGGKTQLTLHLMFASAEERDRIARDHAEEGAKQTLGRLADYVGRLAAMSPG